jgi:hypothetical protein
VPISTIDLAVPTGKGKCVYVCVCVCVCACVRIFA